MNSERAWDVMMMLVVATVDFLLSAYYVPDTMLSVLENVLPSATLEVVFCCWLL